MKQREITNDELGGRVRVLASDVDTRQRVLQKAVEVADAALAKADEAPLPEGLTQHSLRHTYISLRMALGHDRASVAQDAGHADMSVTYRIYMHVMRLDGDDRDRLRALVEGTVWAPMGTSVESTVSEKSDREAQAA